MSKTHKAAAAAAGPERSEVVVVHPSDEIVCVCVCVQCTHPSLVTCVTVLYAPSLDLSPVGSSTHVAATTAMQGRAGQAWK